MSASRMEEAVRIVPVKESDLDDIAALEAHSFPSPWRREFFESELSAPGRYNRLAVSRDRALIGYVFAMFFLDEMHINKIAVVASSRRRGVATALMADCIHFAKLQGILAITLEVRTSNQTAQQFYRAHGFERTYVRPNYYPDGEAAVVMTTKI